MIFRLSFNIPLFTFFFQVCILQKCRFQEMKLLVWIQLPKPLPVRIWQKCLGKKSLMTFFNPTKMGIPFSHTKTQFSPRMVRQCYISECSKYYSPVIINSILHICQEKQHQTGSKQQTNYCINDLLSDITPFWYFAISSFALCTA